MAARLDTLEDAMLFLKLNNITAFKACTNSDKDNTLIFRTDENASVNDNYERFQEVARMTSGSFHIIESAKHGAHKIEVKNDKSYLRSSEPSQPVQIGSVLTPEREAEIAGKAIAEYKKTVELEELRREVKELKKEVNNRTTFDKFYENISPYIPVLINGLAGKFFPQSAPAAIAGLTQELHENTNHFATFEDMENENVKAEIQAISEQDQARIDKALITWYNADPDHFIGLLEAVAGMAERKEVSYNMAKSFILK